LDPGLNAVDPPLHDYLSVRVVARLEIHDIRWWPFDWVLFDSKEVEIPETWKVVWKRRDAIVAQVYHFEL
jgi:hypothetical protein